MPCRNEYNQLQIVPGRRLQRRTLLQTKLSSEPAVEAVHGTIQVGVGTNNGNARTGCGPEGLADGVFGRQALERVEQQRMMSNQGLGPGIAGSFQRREAGIERHQNPVQWSTGVTDLQADIVPVLGQLWSIKFVNQPDQVLYALLLFCHVSVCLAPS